MSFFDGKPPSYRKLWRLVDGAVKDALNMHPEYLTDAGRRSARFSITKRVVGTVHSFAERQGAGQPADTPDTSKPVSGERRARRNVVQGGRLCGWSPVRFLTRWWG